jgi:hypothetical protein
MESKGWLDADWGYTDRIEGEVLPPHHTPRKHLPPSTRGGRGTQGVVGLCSRRVDWPRRGRHAMKRVFEFRRRRPAGSRLDDELRFHLEGRRRADAEGRARDEANARHAGGSATTRPTADKREK